MYLVSGLSIKCDLVGNTYLLTEFRRKGMLLIMFQNPLKWVSMEYTVLAVGFSSNFILVRECRC